MIYKELICKSALNKIKKPMLPYHWDLNIYRDVVMVVNIALQCIHMRI